jgi:predicted deacylase
MSLASALLGHGVVRAYDSNWKRRPIRAVTIAICSALIGAMPNDRASADDGWASLQLLGREIAPGTSNKFPFIPDRSFEASYLNMPVFVARGATSGPTLCLTAGVHGDELNGVEVARRAFAQVDPAQLRGTLIAHEVFSRVIIHCDALVDLHTASNNRANLPQIRADISDPEIRELAIHFGLGIVVGGGGAGPDSSLRREAAKAGIPAIIYEAGEPFRFQQDEIERGVDGVENVMAYLDMTDAPDREIPDARVYELSRWLRVSENTGGFFFPTAELGDTGIMGTFCFFRKSIMSPIKRFMINDSRLSNGMTLHEVPINE